jgi:hypothetical protein
MILSLNWLSLRPIIPTSSSICCVSTYATSIKFKLFVLAHHVLQGTEFPPIHPQMLHNWHIDLSSFDFYRIKPRLFTATPLINHFPHQFYDIHDVGNQ